MCAATALPYGRWHRRRHLIRHDPEFRGVRREHLVEAGRHVRAFPFYVVSAAPRVVVESALAGVVPPSTSLAPTSISTRKAERCARYAECLRVTAVAVIDALRRRLDISSDRVDYIGDGSSDVHVMLHVNNGDGFTIAVSEHPQLAGIAKHTVLSDGALAVLSPILHRCFALTPSDLRDVFEANGVQLPD